ARGYLRPHLLCSLRLRWQERRVPRGPARRGLCVGLPQAQGTGLENHAATGRDPGRSGRIARRTLRHYQGADAPHRGEMSIARPAMSIAAALALALLGWSGGMWMAAAAAQGAHPFGVPES